LNAVKSCWTVCIRQGQTSQSLVLLTSLLSPVHPEHTTVLKQLNYYLLTT